MFRLSDAARNRTVFVTRFLPKIRGHGRLSNNLNSFFLARGCAPLAVAQMRLGHEMLVDTRSSTESYALYSGDYDTQKIRYLMSLMQKKSVFVDVGANVGFYTVPIAKHAESVGGRVYAFEPHPSNFDRLQRNINRNNLDDIVTTFNIGLSSQAGDAELTMREDFAHGSQTGNASILIDDGEDLALPKVRIKLAALDDLYGQHLPRVDLIKVDIEGHEDLFLLGSRKAIAKERPIMMIEVNKEYYRRRGVDLYDEITASLGGGYGIYIPVSNRSLQTSDSFKSLKAVANFEKCLEIDNAFLIPDEKVVFALQALETIQ